jgi:hypothetical protein
LSRIGNCGADRLSGNRRAGTSPTAPPTEPSRPFTVVPFYVTVTHVYKKGCMNEKALLSPLHLCLLIFSHMLSTMLYECSKREQRSATKNKIKSGKIPINGLTDVILALLHAVAAPCHCHRGRHGGRCHRRLVLTPAPPHQPPPSAALHHHVLERPPSPSPDRQAYQSMEPSDKDASPRGL